MEGIFDYIKDPAVILMLIGGLYLVTRPLIKTYLSKSTVEFLDDLLLAHIQDVKNEDMSGDEKRNKVIQLAKESMGESMGESLLSRLLTGKSNLLSDTMLKGRIERLYRKYLKGGQA